MQSKKNENEWINWIEEAISKGYYKFYDYKHFSNVQKIGTGGFGKVYRASWKNSEQYLALKSFFNIDNVTAKAIVHELKLQRDIQFHNNIIKFHGVAQFDPENQNSQSRNYLLVMEYANSGTLKDYLKENFNNLNWNDKYNFAYQLACGVSCLHNEGIVHRDLHSSNVLVHQSTIKLSDFGLSKRIESSSFNTRSKFFGIIPYVDPKKLNGRRKNKNSTQDDKKSDIYSIGVLFWEISSGKPPFYTEGKQYDFELALEITQGLREKPFPNTPEEYIKIYTECWNGEPDNRPTMIQVLESLKAIMTEINVITNDCRTELHLQLASTDDQNFPTNIINSSDTDNSLHGEMSQIIENFDKMNTKEIAPTTLTNEIVHDTVNYIFKIINEGNESTLIKNIQTITYYFIRNSINSREIYNWLLINQNNSDSIFLLGYFNYLGIEASENNKTAFDLFINASEQCHALAQFYVGLCYQSGHGTVKDETLAFVHFEEIANKGYASGLYKIGYFYEEGIATSVNMQKASELYQQAANLGNCMAQYNLAYMYQHGKGIDKDHVKAIELYQKAANSGDCDAQYNLANIYYYGEGVDKDHEKAFELYNKAAESGNSFAQYNLAIMYEFGIGIKKNVNQAIDWYEKSTELGYPRAKFRLEELRNRDFFI
ncbi:kinase-like protein [Rhizophagus irregularis]|uniref:Kinase-like protein n=1 Tax=Rhizophagus irregularis TaxID=588596 RepID=A0A2N1MUB7_9GLOM|nr:kinase-like protein [Rhizophagus irregularis]